MLPGHFDPPVALRTPFPVQQQARQQKTIGGVLQVTFSDSEFDAETGETIFKGGVTATYDQTKIECASLRVNTKTKEGEANEGVVVVDPEGTIHCQSLHFNWEDKTGKAQSVVLQADNFHLVAHEIEIFPERWELRDAEGSLSRTGGSAVTFVADSVTVNPGRFGVARNAYLKVLGKKIGPLPRLSFTLRKRVRGLGLPSITNRKGVGVGITWESGFAVGDHAVLNSLIESFPKREPAIGLQYGYSPLSPESASLIAPRSDLGERVSDGWFDNISVRKPAEEHDEVGAERNTWAAGTFWNQSTSARPVDSDNVSKSFDLTYELGGKWRGLGTYGAVRFQNVRENNEQPFVTRGLFNGTVLAPPLTLNPQLSGHARLDLMGSQSNKGSFGWARFETGLLYAPGSNILLGAAFVKGFHVGNPDFIFDPLSSSTALHARLDLNVGPYTFHYLAKYDLDSKLWYDREYEISLVAREFEPFIVYRQYPSETRIGVRFRIDNLRDRLTRRSQKR
ncbi:MAG: hypothetical protein JSS66_00710 [Armatimonadetes bacterium]|nr:hypothetical protein [Armatimonadota bacterium]